MIASIENGFASFARRAYVPSARLALSVVYIWFGALKVFDLSPAGPLASALVERTVGGAYFEELFLALALGEVALGLLILVPRFTRFVVPVFLVHLAIVSGPLLLVPGLAWDGWFVPSLEGQYIIKNVLIVSALLTIAAGAGRRSK